MAKQAGKRDRRTGLHLPEIGKGAQKVITSGLAKLAKSRDDKAFKGKDAATAVKRLSIAIAATHKERGVSASSVSAALSALGEAGHDPIAFRTHVAQAMPEVYPTFAAIERGKKVTDDVIPLTNYAPMPDAPQARRSTICTREVRMEDGSVKRRRIACEKILEEPVRITPEHRDKAEPGWIGLPCGVHAPGGGAGGGSQWVGNYALVPISSLLLSHAVDGTRNPQFGDATLKTGDEMVDAELRGKQPHEVHERIEVASEPQPVLPLILNDNPTTFGGPPVVDRKWRVLSGTVSLLAVQRWTMSAHGADHYAEALRIALDRHAQTWGLSELAALPAIERYVVVRVIVEEFDPATIVSILNTGWTSSHNHCGDAADCPVGTAPPTEVLGLLHERLTTRTCDSFQRVVSDCSHVVNTLSTYGWINASNRARWVRDAAHGPELTPQGADALRRCILGELIGSRDVHARLGAGDLARLEDVMCTLLVSGHIKDVRHALKQYSQLIACESEADFKRQVAKYTARGRKPGRDIEQALVAWFARRRVLRSEAAKFIVPGLTAEQAISQLGVTTDPLHWQAVVQGIGPRHAEPVPLAPQIMSPDGTAHVYDLDAEPATPVAAAATPVAPAPAATPAVATYRATDKRVAIVRAGEDTFFNVPAVSADFKKAMRAAGAPFTEGTQFKLKPKGDVEAVKAVLDEWFGHHGAAFEAQDICVRVNVKRAGKAFVILNLKEHKIQLADQASAVDVSDRVLASRKGKKAAVELGAGVHYADSTGAKDARALKFPDTTKDGSLGGEGVILRVTKVPVAVAQGVAKNSVDVFFPDQSAAAPAAAEAAPKATRKRGKAAAEPSDKTVFAFAEGVVEAPGFAEVVEAPVEPPPTPAQRRRATAPAPTPAPEPPAMIEKPKPPAPPRPATPPTPPAPVAPVAPPVASDDDVPLDFNDEIMKEFAAQIDEAPAPDLSSPRDVTPVTPISAEALAEDAAVLVDDDDWAAGLDEIADMEPAEQVQRIQSLGAEAYARQLNDPPDVLITRVEGLGRPQARREAEAGLSDAEQLEMLRRQGNESMKKQMAALIDML